MRQRRGTTASLLNRTLLRTQSSPGLRIMSSEAEATTGSIRFSPPHGKKLHCCLAPTITTPTTTAPRASAPTPNPLTMNAMVVPFLSMAST